MVYAVFSELLYPYKLGQAGGPTGKIRLVNMGNIEQPKNRLPDKKNPYQYDETYFSNYDDAKANFDELKRLHRYMGNMEIEFCDET